MPRKVKSSNIKIKDQGSKYKIGSVTVSKSGAENGIYITELQSEKVNKQEIFASLRVIGNSGKKATDFKNGQLVRYKVNQEVDSLVEEIEAL